MKHLLFLLVFTSTSLCQSFFFDKGSTGLSAGYGYTSNESSGSHAFSAVCTINGIVDLGVSYSQSTGKESNIDVSSYLPSIAVNIRRDSKLGGARLSVGYLSSKMSRAFHYSYLGLTHTFDLEVTGLILNASAAVQLFNNGQVGLLFVPGFTYGFLDSDEIEIENTKSFSIELPIRFLDKGGLFISPGMSMAIGEVENVFSFGFSVGILADFSNKEM